MVGIEREVHSVWLATPVTGGMFCVLRTYLRHAAIIAIVAAGNIEYSICNARLGAVAQQTLSSHARLWRPFLSLSVSLWAPTALRHQTPSTTATQTLIISSQLPPDVAVVVVDEFTCACVFMLCSRAPAAAAAAADAACLLCVPSCGCGLRAWRASVVVLRLARGAHFSGLASSRQRFA